MAAVRFPKHTEGIVWVLLEYDRAHTGGWYLYGYRANEEGYVFDSWHKSKAEAQEAALRDLGVSPADWQRALSR